MEVLDNKIKANPSTKKTVKKVKLKKSVFEKPKDIHEEKRKSKLDNKQGNIETGNNENVNQKNKHEHSSDEMDADMEDMDDQQMQMMEECKLIYIINYLLIYRFK